MPQAKAASPTAPSTLPRWLSVCDKRWRCSNHPASTASSTAFHIFSPAGTPQAIIGRVHDAVAHLLADPALQRQMMDAGFDVVTGPNTTQAWRDLLASEVVKWTQIVRQAGLRPG